MRIDRRDGSDERRILIGMIVDNEVLAKISSSWTKEGLFNSQWANLIGAWCVKYQDKYGTPPGKSIEPLFESWAADSTDKDTVAIVEKFLGGLSSEYESRKKSTSSEFLLDLAGRHFNKVRLAKLAETIQGDIESGDLDKATGRLDKFNRIEMGSGAGIDVINDMGAIQAAFESNQEPLIKYPNALGRFFDDALQRDSFISFMAPEKRGKTFWLMDAAWRAMLQRRRVAFFAVGDMSEKQMLRRFQSRAARAPLKARTVKYPISIEKDPDENFAMVEHEDRVFDTALSWRAGWAACQKVVKRIKTTDPYLRLSCHPNSSISVKGIAAILQGWERANGWVPDVVVIDYADILAPPPGIAESRDATNMSWKQMRALSQQLHCCLITATQADAGSYGAETMDMSNFSEDKRKFAHVTGMAGINQTRAEKERGLMRLNWLVLRESDFNITRCVHVATCLDIANPAILSTF